MNDLFRKYRTEYPNEVHQITVSVSKHLYVKKNGRVAWQKKPFEVDLQKLEAAKKDHIVHYLIKDHFSGTFYGEVGRASEILSLGEFLFRAWSLKEKYLFFGMPAYAIIPQVVIDYFPPVENLLRCFEIKYQTATSGFQAGVRTIRTWDENVYYHATWPGKKLSFSQLQAETEDISYDLCAERAAGSEKYYKWKHYMLKDNRKISVPPSKEKFLSCYI